MTFFGTREYARAFEGLTITSRTGGVSARGRRKLAVAVRWGPEEPQRVSVTRTLSRNVWERGGAAVHVYVIGADGRGLPGFEVRAGHHCEKATATVLGQTKSSVSRTPPVTCGWTRCRLSPTSSR
jgi:hypothetical protein